MTASILGFEHSASPQRRFWLKCETPVLTTTQLLAFSWTSEYFGFNVSNLMTEEDIQMGKPLVGIIMGSVSDWDTMQHAAEMLSQLAVPYEKRIVSAHRTPELMMEYAKSAEQRGLRVIIAGAGGAAHLPGMTAAMTWLPVFGVPVSSRTLSGMDSLLSIVQMPAGIPVPTLAIGRPGAVNAALAAASVIALSEVPVKRKLQAFKQAQTAKVEAMTLPAHPGPCEG